MTDNNPQFGGCSMDSILRATALCLEIGGLLTSPPTPDQGAAKEISTGIYTISGMVLLRMQAMKKMQHHFGN